MTGGADPLLIPPSELGTFLRTFRKLRGQTLRQLQQHMEDTMPQAVSHNTLHRVEKGEDINLNSYVKLTTYLAREVEPSNGDGQS